MDYAIILTTCPDENEAKNLASKLIAEKLAACVQLSGIQSYYTWKNKTCIDPEVRLTIKTRTPLFKQVETFIQQHHSYEVPQVIMVPVANGSEAYLDWIDENTIG
jgi:periplasmic divalent cation tolerance protein